MQDSTNTSEKAKFLTGKRKTLLICCIIFSLAYGLIFIVPMAFNLFFISALGAVLIFVSILIMNSVFLGMLVKHYVGSKGMKILLMMALTALTVCVAATTLFFGWLVSSRSYRMSVSPNGDNHVVVLEKGLFDSSYEAYPLKLGVFYQRQNNGFLSYHDLWGTPTVNMEWVSDDTAIITVEHLNYQPNQNSNMDNRIVVRFN